MSVKLGRGCGETRQRVGVVGKMDRRTRRGRFHCIQPCTDLREFIPGVHRLIADVCSNLASMVETIILS